ncbi:MAG TPA: hypothetical protein DDW42_04880 [Desulfobacteraceae bacterium]|nr:hypothetical protein [Desulfobacteraceae bacterium]
MVFFTEKCKEELSIDAPPDLCDYFFEALSIPAEKSGRIFVVLQKFGVAPRVSMLQISNTRPQQWSVQALFERVPSRNTKILIPRAGIKPLFFDLLI